MPDWFYRTGAQPALFCLPQKTSRAIALGVIGTLGRSAAGRALIEFMGHMATTPGLGVCVAGVEYPSPIGLGWRVDPEKRATRGLSCFGLGCIETWTGPQRTVRRAAGEELRDGELGGEVPRSAGESGRAPLLRRSVDASGREIVQLPTDLNLPVVAWDDVSIRAEDCGAGAVLQVGARLSTGGWRVPAAMPEELPERVRAWRRKISPGAPLLVAGGVSCPRDALALLDAGASLLLVDAGLIYHGPGLVKRCNEALAQRLKGADEPRRDGRLFRRAWFWTGALGAAMVIGGGLTLILALTRVLLPYDEQYLGLTADTLRRTSPQLFAFMSHDRGTLAGTMLGLGWLYLMLAWHGVRCGRHGTRTTVIASAMAGFVSFFAFFGFGYFDTLHAFVAAVLFQLTVQIMIGDEGGGPAPTLRVDDEDAVWRRAQWGQLLWVVHAVGLLVAGVVILGIGMTSVFVNEDLKFLCMTEVQAQDLGAKMIGVVAHDRATLGGMLLASGVAMLLSVLWCFRRGEQWLWWAVAGLGVPAYAAALGVHLRVGYTDWRHMVPAFLGLSLWLGGLLLTRAHLHRGSGAV